MVGEQIYAISIYGQLTASLTYQKREKSRMVNNSVHPFGPMPPYGRNSCERLGGKKGDVYVC